MARNSERRQVRGQVLTGAGETRGAGRGQRFLPGRAPHPAPCTPHPAGREPPRASAGVRGVGNREAHPRFGPRECQARPRGTQRVGGGMTRPEAGVPRSRWEQICPLLPQLMARHAPCPRQSSRAAVKPDLWFSVSWAAVTSFFSEGAPEMGDPPPAPQGPGRGARTRLPRAPPDPRVSDPQFLAQGNPSSTRGGDCA